MTPSLEQIQKQFSKALHYQATGDECNVVNDNFTADERIQVYRNNFIISLSEVLALTYPNVLELVGTSCFDGLARQHILNIPLLKGDVTCYGGGFSDTIKTVESVISSVPYLADVAKLEWAIDDSNQKHNHPLPAANLYAFEQLSEFTPEQQSNIKLKLHPSLNLVASDFSVLSLRRAIEKQQFEHLVLDQPQYIVVLVRSKNELLLDTIDKQSFRLLEQIGSDFPLGKINQDLLSCLPNLISLNLFVGFQVTNP